MAEAPCALCGRPVDLQGPPPRCPVHGEALEPLHPRCADRMEAGAGPPITGPPDRLRTSEEVTT